jgi:TrmH family RNA methyltransferase
MAKLGKKSSTLKNLKRRVRKRQQGEVVIDGPRLIDDVVRWGMRLGELFVTPELADSKRGSRWASVAGQVWEVEGSVLAGIAPTKNPQGALAIVDEPVWPAWYGKSGVTVFLAGVQDPGNVGAIIRSAAAFGAEAVLLAPGSADPFHPAVVRGSAAAVFRICIERDADVAAAAERQRTAGGEVWATGLGGMRIEDWRPQKPMLLVVGTEGAGLEKPIQELGDGLVTIALDREVDSLNVAVATGVFLHRLRSLGSSEL